MTTYHKFWFPVVSDAEGEPRFPFGISYPEGSWRTLILEIFSNFPSEFEGKYIVPVATSREKMIEFFTNWEDALKQNFIPKIPYGWALRFWKCENKNQWDFTRNSMENVIRQGFGLTIRWLYDWEDCYDSFVKAGSYMTRSSQMQAGIRLFNVAYNIMDKLRGLI